MELGPFQLEERIGHGAMGEVWRAHHRRNEMPAAIKVITAVYASREDYRRRFRNEIRSAAALNHPGIIRVYDYGEVDQEAAAASGLELRPDSPYFAMELADEGSVDALESEIGWSDLRELLVGLLQALGHAHARGVFHRDLKPSNILLGRDHRGRPRYKVSDFGLAFDRDRALDSDRDRDGAVGTPHYMAPEQLRSRWRDIGPWTDLYSLGCMTWRLVTGEAPFKGDALLEVARSHLTQPLPEFDPRFEVPDDLEHWLARLLEKHPHDRFRRAADAIWALLEIPESLAGESSAAIEVDDRPTMARTSVTDPLESLADDTRIEPDVPMDTPEPRETMTPDHSGDPPQSIEPVDRELPPVPGDWEQRRPPTGTLPHMTAGRELFSLREFPTVGREKERDRLWRALREVVETQSTKLVLLEGDAGVGKTRLARWLGERAEEVGAAQALATSHDPETREGGLSELLRTHMAIGGMERDEAVDRAETWYAARGIDRAYESRAAVEYVLGSGGEGMTSTLQRWGGDDPEDPRGEEAAAAPDADTEVEEEKEAGRVQFSGAHEIRALVRRFLECAAEERPLVVCLDDLQWGLETIHFLDYLLGSSHTDDLPVLVVATLRDDALAERPLESDAIDELRDHDETDPLRIGPMSETDQRFLVEELLDLAPAVAERVVDRAGGNPQFAVELVRDWIERDLLKPTDRGFALAGEADPRIPENLYEIWSSRLDEILDETDDRLREALQLGAILGEEIDASEWRAACEAADLPFPNRLLPLLLHHSLLHETDDGWRFAHSLLRETLVRRGEEEGRREEFNRACAEAVESDEKSPAETARYAHYLLAAGEHRRALEPLIEAAENFGASKKFHRARSLLQTARDCADEITLEEHPDLEARLCHVRGRLAVTVDEDLDRAQRAFDRAVRLGESAGDWRVWARALNGKSTVASMRADAESELEWAERASEICEDEESPEKLRSEFNRAFAKDRAGHFRKANQLYQRTLDRARSQGIAATVVKVLQNWARCLLFQEDLNRAEERSREGLRGARDLGDLYSQARCCNLLGEVARKRENFEAAESWYRKAERFASLVDTPELFPCYLGRTQIELQTGRVESAIQSLRTVERRTEGRAPLWFRTALVALKFEAHSRSSDWEQIEAVLDEHADRFSENLPTVKGAAESFGRAAREAAEADRFELAERLGELASRVWRKIDESRARALGSELSEYGVNLRN